MLHVFLATNKKDGSECYGTSDIPDVSSAEEEVQKRFEQTLVIHAMLPATPQVLQFLGILPNVMPSYQALHGVAGLLRLGAKLKKMADELAAEQRRQMEETMSDKSGI